MLWRRFTGEPLRMPVKKAVEEAIIRETNAGFKLKVCIGTDSQVRSTETEFATVIVFLREKHGGFMFISNDFAHFMCEKLCLLLTQSQLPFSSDFLKPFLSRSTPVFLHSHPCTISRTYLSRIVEIVEIGDVRFRGWFE